MSAAVANTLWQALWDDYTQRVNYARIYQQMIEDAGGRIANDHIAWRSLRLTLDEGINLGISYVARIAEALGYHVAGEYTFPDQFLYAQHYQHPQQDEFDLPKLFISELIVDALPNQIQEIIVATVREGSFFTEIDESPQNLKKIFTRPWNPPQKSIVESVNQVTQYGAWVLLHGYSVNHFTGYVNRHQTPLYPDIESTVKGLIKKGVPMKTEIEGSIGSGLRQTATQAVTEMVTVIDDATGELILIPWTYAYYEIAQRNEIVDDTGEKVLFQGFLNSQAKNLFEMTRLNK